MTPHLNSHAAIGNRFRPQGETRFCLVDLDLGGTPSDYVAPSGRRRVVRLSTQFIPSRNALWVEIDHGAIRILLARYDSLGRPRPGRVYVVRDSAVLATQLATEPDAFADRGAYLAWDQKRRLVHVVLAGDLSADEEAYTFRICDLDRLIAQRLRASLFQARREIEEGAGDDDL
jgi:hypothetical protein